MNIEFSWGFGDSSLLGIMTAIGEDENGQFRMVSIGILFCEVSLYVY